MVPKHSSEATSLCRGQRPRSLCAPPGWGQGDAVLGPSRELVGSVPVGARVI